MQEIRRHSPAKTDRFLFTFAVKELTKEDQSASPCYTLPPTGHRDC